MEDYFNTWGLKINSSKTIFSRGKVRKLPDFILNERKLEIVYNYKYVGVNFNYNGKFNVAKISYIVKDFVP